jgi:hypothetical protein
MVCVSADPSGTARTGGRDAPYFRRTRALYTATPPGERYSLWIFRRPAATSPAVELQRGVVEVGCGWRRRTTFAIVWDTEHGHVICLQPVGDTGSDHKDWMAVSAAELIEPRWWASAVVVMPMEETLSRFYRLDPFAYVYRLPKGVPVVSFETGLVLRASRPATARTRPNTTRVVPHSVPSWVTAVNAAPGSGQPSNAGTTRRCALGDTGMNSVSPCTSPRRVACNHSITRSPAGPAGPSVDEHVPGDPSSRGAPDRPLRPALLRA